MICFCESFMLFLKSAGGNTRFLFFEGKQGIFIPILIITEKFPSHSCGDSAGSCNAAGE
jgi:hypothetical protein